MGKNKKKKSRKSNNDKKSGGGGGSGSNDVDIVIEDRFAAAETRPQFRPLKQKQAKVVLDERFSSVLTDPRFQLHGGEGGGEDKYGRKNRKKKKQRAKDELSAFYTVEEKEEREKDDDDDDDKDDKGKKKALNDRSTSRLSDPTDNGDDDKGDNEGNDHDEDDDTSEVGEGENQDPESRIAYLTALSRGELDVSSSSDEDESSADSSDDDDNQDDGDSNDEEGEDPVYGTAGVLDPSNKEQEEEIEISYDSSPYLVATNMDWDHFRAIDLLAILSSFTPPGSVKRVQVYQSDFGIERMARDRLYGPSNIWKKNKKEDNTKDQYDDETDDDEEEEDARGADSDNDDEESENVDMVPDDDDETNIGRNITQEVESDYDPEKLRAYEASKLKYYFAIVEFASPEYADVAYREVDGLEFEHSSAAIDLRTIPSDEISNVVTDRPLRDEATSIPSNYEPPDFVVSALQQTTVQCTWDQGDVDRERKLTNYGTAGWEQMAETDDLKAYLASDDSSDDDDDDDDDEGSEKGQRKATKGSKMRKLLGLDSDADDDEQDDGSSSDDNNNNDGDDDDDDGETMDKEIKFIPGQKDLQEKIRNKVQSKRDESNKREEELTPWEKYKQKRKEKRKERRQAARGKRKEKIHDDDDGEEEEEEDVDENAQEREASGSEDEDDFFVDEGFSTKKGKKITGDKLKNNNKSKNDDNADGDEQTVQQQKLELLLAGEQDDEEMRDYDIRGIQRLEKNKGKKLKGVRKRKEDKIAADISGTEFQINVQDHRFDAVLDGTDGKFGIDTTDPNFKNTTGMRTILAEQSRRRRQNKKRKNTSSAASATKTASTTTGSTPDDNSNKTNKRKKKNNDNDKVVPNVSADNPSNAVGSSALSSLVQRLKSKVGKNSQ